MTFSFYIWLNFAGYSKVMAENPIVQD